MKLKVKRLHSNAFLPTRAYEHDLGFDLYAPENVTLSPQTVTLVDTQIAIEFPKRYVRDISKANIDAIFPKWWQIWKQPPSAHAIQEYCVANNQYEDRAIEWYGGLIRDRSSVATKLKVFTVAGVIDNAYTGNIKVAFYNSTSASVVFALGDKIAQLILTKTYDATVIEIFSISETQRGSQGFGSSGK